MPKYPVKEFHKYPEEVEGPFRPEFKFDSRGRLIIPLPGYSKLALETRPGSKETSFQPEDETEGTPMIYPGTIKTGALHASTVLTVGDPAAWRVQISGQQADYPIVYTDGEVMKFYVDKQGTVYLEGTIKASAGEIGGWSISIGDIVELYAGSGATRVGLRPGSWPFYAGADDPTDAHVRINQAGQAWFTSIELLGGAGVGDLAVLDQVGNLQVMDLAITEEKLAAAAVAWEKLKDEAVHADKVWKGGKVITLSAQIEEGIIKNAHIKNLDAIKINVGTLTGFTIQTATSGQRVALEGSGGPYGYPHEVLVYPPSGTAMRIYGGASYFYVTANLAVKPIRFDNPFGSVALQINETSIYVPGNITVGGTVDGVNVSLLTPTAIATSLTPDQNYVRGLGITSKAWGTTFLGQTRTKLLYPGTSLTYDLGASSIYWRDLYLRYLRFHASYGRIYHGTKLMLNFFGSDDKLACKTPFGFEVRSGTPGSASNFEGYMYFDTAQNDLVFSNGEDWYKVTAEMI